MNFKKTNYDDNEAIDIECYCSKLNTVFNLLLIDVPDTYDDTLNSKVLDSIKNLIKHERLQVFLSEYFRTKLDELAHKDDEIQTFFLNLIAIVIDENIRCLDEQFLDKLIQYLIDNNANSNATVEYAVMNLTIAAVRSDLLKVNEKFKTFVKRNYLENFTLFFNKSIFICQLYGNLVRIYLKNLYTSEHYEDIDVYFESVRRVSREHYNDVIFAFFESLFMLYNELRLETNVVTHLDAHLKVLLQDNDFNELASQLKSINFIESFTFIWFKFNQTTIINNLLSIITSFKNFSFIFKFLSCLHQLIANEEEKRQILELYLLPINDFNCVECNYVTKLAVDFKQKESILNHCLLSSYLIADFLSIHLFNLSNLSVILKHFNLNSRIKKNLLKLLLKITFRGDLEEAKSGKYYLLYSILYDYAVVQLDSDEDLMKIFIIYLNNSKADENENDELIEAQLFNYIIKYQAKTNNRDNILNTLVQINNQAFAYKLITNDNFSFIMSVYKSLLNSSIEDDDELTDLKEILFKLFTKFYKIFLDSPLKSTAFDEYIFDHELYLSSNMQVRQQLIMLVNQLFNHYLLLNDYSMLERFFNYYAFILGQISNDYHNHDTFDIEIMCLNIYYELLHNTEFMTNKNNILNLFIDSSLSGLVRLIENDYFYSENSKSSYIKNIKLSSANLLDELFKSESFKPGKELTELVKNVKLKCENCCFANLNNNYNNPFMILDDIISSYEFNMNDNKISDCY